MLVRDVMTTDEVATVMIDASAEEAARQLAKALAGAVVVVDTARRPIGMITRSDMERARVRNGAPPPWLIKPGATPAFRSAPPPLRDIMSAPVISVPDVARLLELVPLVKGKRLKRIPVVKGGALVGILCRADILGAINDRRSNAHPRVAKITAAEFRDLVVQHEERERAQHVEARRVALEAQMKLIEELAKRRLSERAWAEMIAGARRAASAGLKECVLLRFPAQLCADGGRAINAPDPHWPETLRGEAREIFERWRNELQPAGFGLAGQIISFPDGIPGDAALILTW